MAYVKLLRTFILLNHAFRPNHLELFMYALQETIPVFLVVNQAYGMLPVSSKHWWHTYTLERVHAGQMMDCQKLYPVNIAVESAFEQSVKLMQLQDWHA